MCSAPGLLPKNIVRAYLLELVPKKVRRQKLVLQSSNGAPGLKTGCPAGCGAPQFLSACDSSSSVARRVRFIEFTRLPGWLTTGWVWSTFLPACLAQGSVAPEFIEPTSKLAQPCVVREARRRPFYRRSMATP